MKETYTFSVHAKERMRARGITESDISDAIKRPDSAVYEHRCKEIIHKIIFENDEKKLLRIFVNTCKEPNLIITAYKTSKIDKYEY
jgi:hypothetical protein